MELLQTSLGIAQQSMGLVQESPALFFLLGVVAYSVMMVRKWMQKPERNIMPQPTGWGTRTRKRR